MKTPTATVKTEAFGRPDADDLVSVINSHSSSSYRWHEREPTDSNSTYTRIILYVSAFYIRGRKENPLVIAPSTLTCLHTILAVRKLGQAGIGSFHLLVVLPIELGAVYPAEWLSTHPPSLAKIIDWVSGTAVWRPFGTCEDSEATRMPRRYRRGVAAEWGDLKCLPRIMSLQPFLFVGATHVRMIRRPKTNTEYRQVQDT